MYFIYSFTKYSFNWLINAKIYIFYYHIVLTSENQYSLLFVAYLGLFHHYYACLTHANIAVASLIK
jgi:hypothetical protein